MRTKYKWGATQWLANFKVGETKECDGSFRVTSLRRIASNLKRDFGVKYTFESVLDKVYVKRLK